MQIFFEDLLQLQIFSKAKLLTGREGGAFPVRRPYICLTPDHIRHLAGGELIFISSRLTEFSDDILKLLLLFSEKKAAGLFLLGHPDFSLCETRLADQARQLSLPLALLPESIDLSLSVQEVYRQLDLAEGTERDNRRFLEQVLFERSLRQDDIIRMAKFYNTTLLPVFFIGMLGNSLHTDSGEFIRYLLPAASRQLKSLQINTDYSLVFASFADTLLVLAFAPEEKAARTAMNDLSRLCEDLRARYLNMEFSLSFSRIHERLTELPVCYREASCLLSAFSSAIW